MAGQLRRTCTKEWTEVVALLVRSDSDKKRSFCTRYAFQAIVHDMERKK